MTKKILFLLFFCSILIFSQQRIEKLERLFDKFGSVINQDADSALYYCKQANELNRKIGNDYYRSRCLILYAAYYYNMGDNARSNSYNEQALVFAERTNNNSALYRIYNLKGVILYESSEYDKAFKEFQKAKYYLKKEPDDKYYGILHFNLGNLFIAKGDTISAVKNFQTTSRYATLARDTARIISSYIAIANATQSKDYQKANTYYEDAFSLSQKTNDRQEQFNIRFNQSHIFLDSYDRVKNEQALTYLKMAETLLKELGDKSLYFYVYFNYGAFYMNMNDHRNAMRYYELAFKNYDAKKIPVDQKLNILKSLSNIYSKNHNFEQSYIYQTKFYNLKDSLFTLEKEKNYNRLLTKFEVEKKNSQIKLLRKENELQEARKIRMYFVLGLLITMILSSFLFYQNKLRSQQKLNVKQQELNRTKNILEGQNKERNRLAKELHDGIAGSLVGINYMLDNENNTLKNKNLAIIHHHINTLHEEIREISHDLSNNFLIDKSLLELVQHLAKQNEEIRNLKTDILFFPENALQDIDDEVKTHLYRIIQEILANIHKHASAESVQINVTQHLDFICLMIEDNGSGFDVNNKLGIGILNIHERLKTFDAMMEIDSSPNRGTTVTITFKV